MKMRTWLTIGVAALMLSSLASGVSAAPAPDSKRLGLAKDYIADEQWARAIVALQAVAADPREANRDEALFWLAHSEHETGDQPAAIQTIARLEQLFPGSRWVRPARSLRVEIAQRLNRDDVLWAMVAPPTPPAPAHPWVMPPVPPRVPAAAVGPDAPPPPRGMPPVPVPRVHPAGTLVPAGSAAPAAPFPILPGVDYFLPVTPYPPDTDLRIEALSGLLEGHGERVIPLLRDIALDGHSPDEARRAILVLARSHRPEARTTVAEVARRGADTAQLAAIRELGRFDGTGVSAVLMQVYVAAPTLRVKRQVVSSLGERGDTQSLLGIARTESDMALRNTAIVTLGRLAGTRAQLRTLYEQAPPASRMAVLAALFTSKDEDELIRIARAEQEPLLRQRARMQLRMLATPKALKFLADNP